MNMFENTVKRFSLFEISLLAAKFTAKAISQKNPSEKFFLSLPGGSTPSLYFKILANRPELKQHWHRVMVFQGDERFLPPSSPLLNSRLIQKSFISQFNSNPPDFFKINTNVQSPQEAATAYQKIISEHLPATPDGLPAFDLTVLGIGTDGHVASLFPNSPAFTQNSNFFLNVPPPTTCEPFVERLTMTIPAINNSKLKLFLLSGRDKLELLEKPKKSLPFSLITNPFFFASIHR